METSNCSHWSDSQVKIDVAKREGRVTSKGTSIDCSRVLLQGIPTTSRVDKGIILKRYMDQSARASAPCHGPRLWHKVACYDDWARFAHLLHRNHDIIFKSCLSNSFFQTKHEPPEESVISMIAFMIASADLYQSIWSNKILKLNKFGPIKPFDLI